MTNARQHWSLVLQIKQHSLTRSDNEVSGFPFPVNQKKRLGSEGYQGVSWTEQKWTGNLRFQI